MDTTVHVMYEGYSYMNHGEMFANCSCTLIKGSHNIIVDCMTAWDKDKIIEGLQSHGLQPSQIDYAIATHGHSDHLGNLNLFTNAKAHIVGFTISKENIFFIHPFESGEPYLINEHVKVIPTPGHTSADVSVVVSSADQGVVVIAGDLFEKLEDIADERIWKYDAGSENPLSQEKHRNEVLLLADYIVPGHGPMFQVTQEMKRKAIQTK